VPRLCVPERGSSGRQSLVCLRADAIYCWRRTGAPVLGRPSLKEDRLAPDERHLFAHESQNPSARIFESERQCRDN
jgi:hypothetical protein